MTALHMRQIWLVARLHLLRVFFSRRSFWIYGLALFPAIPFFGKAVETQLRRSAWAGREVAAVALEAIREGAAEAEVLASVGRPVSDQSDDVPRRFLARNSGKYTGPVTEAELNDRVQVRNVEYYDGENRWRLRFEEGVLTSINSRPLINFEQDRLVFAAVFQHFFLRLAVFFGCLGIFINLFRGEMLDKTLHFWFLAPMRREVLLGGKYLAGLIAAAVIFTFGAVLAYLLMLWPQDPAQATAFWSANGPRHLFWYAASVVLACLGYGSVFLGAGMLLRNPIVPAVVILLWESVNGVLPAILQKLSILYYVQSLAPVPPPMDPSAPLVVKLLASPATPASPLLALTGVLALTAVVLWLSAGLARKLEINYGTD